MTEILKQHPLRNIVLRFDLSKEMSDFEKEGLETYYRIHDETWDMSMRLNERTIELTHIDAGISRLHKELLPMEQKLDQLEADYGLRDGEDLPQMEEKVTHDGETFYSFTIPHNKKMVDLAKLLMEEWKWYDAQVDHMYYHEGWLKRDARAPVHVIYRRYKEASVDIVSLDKDEQKFLTAHSKVWKQQDAYFEYANKVFDAFEGLRERTENLYIRIEYIDNMLDGLL